jgi:KEOPS complex subunit Pcc1
MRHEALFRFRSAHADHLFRAVSPEMEGECNPRSKAECLFESPDTLVLKVHAADIAALRASLNMWLRLISVAQEMQELLNNQETIP